MTLGGGSPEVGGGFVHCAAEPMFDRPRAIYGARNRGGRKGSCWLQFATGSVSPSATHCAYRAIGRSVSRVTPKPRGNRPSIDVLTMPGARKASDSVMRIERSVLPLRAAINSTLCRGSAIGSSSQRCALRKASISPTRAFARIGRIDSVGMPSPWMTYVAGSPTAPSIERSISDPVLRRRWRPSVESRSCLG